MSTAREHMATDLAYVLEDTGEGAEIVSIDFGDGTGAGDVHCFLDQLESGPGGFDGANVERMQLTTQPSLLATPVVDQEIIVNGVRVRVVAVDATDHYLDFIYERYLS